MPYNKYEIGYFSSKVTNNIESTNKFRQIEKMAGEEDAELAVKFYEAVNKICEDNISDKQVKYIIREYVMKNPNNDVLSKTRELFGYMEVFNNDSISEEYFFAKVKNIFLLKLI